jgi:hypothetical protein
MSVILNDDTFDEYAVKNYKNPNCTSVLEFLDDLKTLKYIKRLINRNELKERLILNHIISLSNVFGVEASVNMLYYKIELRNKHILNAFLVFLNYIPVESVDVLDLNLLNKLKKVI